MFTKIGKKQNLYKAICGIFFTKGLLLNYRDESFGKPALMQDFSLPGKEGNPHLPLKVVLCTQSCLIAFRPFFVEEEA